MHLCAAGSTVNVGTGAAGSLTTCGVLSGEKTGHCDFDVKKNETQREAQFEETKSALLQENGCNSCIKEQTRDRPNISDENMDKNLVFFITLVAFCILTTCAFDPLTLNGLDNGFGNGRFNTVNGRNGRNIGRGRGLNNGRGINNGRGRGRGVNGGRGINGRPRGRPNNRGRLRNSPLDVLDHLSLMLPGK